MIRKVSTSQRYCILGAGTSGLTTLKNFLQAGVPCDCLERESDIGGNWLYGSRASSVYRSTHLISSKRLTEFVDFPMPEAYPAFPSHVQVWQYLDDYARHFALRDKIEFDTEVDRVDVDPTGVDVTLASGQTRRYAGVIIANGHNWDPKWPDIPGDFAGRLLHSSQYKTPEVLTNQRVLVIGAGNSGCDIAVESAQHAQRTYHSHRRGYHYLPKFVRGKPIDECGETLLRLRIPLGMRRWIANRVIRLAVGSPQAYGLPAPDHRLFETHPIINSQMLYCVGHGTIQVTPNVIHFEGNTAIFADGSRAEIDVVVCATGFNLSFPFLDVRQLNAKNGRPDLLLHIFHPDHDRLLVAGLIQPDSGQWGLVDDQARLMARYLVAKRESPAVAARFRQRLPKAAQGMNRGLRYVDSPRHYLEVEHFSYRRLLQKLLRRL